MFLLRDRVLMIKTNDISISAKKQQKKDELQLNEDIIYSSAIKKIIKIFKK